MADVSNQDSPTRRTVLGQIAGSALVAATPSLGFASLASAVNLPREPMIQVWEHSANVDIAPTVKELGFNTVWTHDKAYDGYKLEDTLMYKHLQVPGIKYVIAKIERSIWGWRHQESLAHVKWLASVSRTEKRIVGVYLNDFYGEMDAARRPEEVKDPRSQGGRTDAQWREIIAAIREGNPELPIWLPCYPRNELYRAFDYDFDAIIASFYAQGMIPYVNEVLTILQKKFKGKPVVAGVYINSGTERRLLTEAEFRGALGAFVREINAGRLAGLRIFRCEDLQKHPEYAKWAKEEFSKLKRA